MRHVEAVREIIAGLRSTADPERAVREKRYLKSELHHLGVKVPRIRKVVNAFAGDHPELTRDDVVAIVGALWGQPVHECRVAAVELLNLSLGLLEAGDIRLVEGLIRQSGTWALVDPLAVGVAGGLVERFPQLSETLDGWAVDDDLWVRRSALLTPLRPLRRGAGDFERFARYADGMLDEREFFIRKAIGWVLREVGKKRPGLVVRWLRPRSSRASGVTVREAVKYLPENDRSAILRAYRG